MIYDHFPISHIFYKNMYSCACKSLCVQDMCIHNYILDKKYKANRYINKALGKNTLLTQSQNSLTRHSTWFISVCNQCTTLVQYTTKNCQALGSGEAAHSVAALNEQVWRHEFKSKNLYTRLDVTFCSPVLWEGETGELLQLVSHQLASGSVRGTTSRK